MISEVVMPQMGADMTEGTIVRWLKAEGDDVARGEVIAEIETDKANVEIEAFESGTFRRVLAQEGDVIAVGGVIAIIAGAADDISAYTAGTPAAASAPVALARAAVPATPAAAPVPVATANGRHRASPLARRLAAERGVDIAAIHGSGPDGRILKRDIDAAAGVTAASMPSARKPPVNAVPAPSHSDVPVAATKMRQAIARRMSQSKREAPHYYLLLDVDMTATRDTRAQINDSVPETAHVSINDLIVRACAIALERHPEFNATIEGDVVTRHADRNICIAVALDDGLIAPAIVGAGVMTLLEVAAAAKDLAARARGGKLRPAEVNAGTFTISNLGAYGVEALIGIIQPPQTAILGVGSITPRPVAMDGVILVRQIMKVALSADHRVTDGAQGAQFLAEIKSLLERPAALLL